MLPAFCLLVTTCALGQTSCPASGLYLDTSGGRLGDPWLVALHGSAGAAGYLGADVAGGPTSTPIGQVCLGFTPSIALVPFTLDALGEYSMSGVLPPNPSLTGLDVFLQAAAIDANLPGGVAVSNGASITLRPPRAFIFYGGELSVYPNVPGSYCVYDFLTDTLSAPIPLPGVVQDVIMVPALGWFAVLFFEGGLACYDANTGAQTLFQQIPWTPGAAPGIPSQLEAEGTTLYVLYSGAMGSFLNYPGGVRSYSLPSGAPGFSCVLPAGRPHHMVILPGQGIGYVVLADSPSIAPVNLVTGAPLPSIVVGGPAGPITETVLVGPVLYCLMRGIGLNLSGIPQSPGALAAVDTLTHTVQTAPVLLPTFGFDLRWGPAIGGNALLVHVPYSTNSLIQVDPATFGIVASTIIPTPFWNIVLSTGATEWLVLGTGSTPSLYSVDPATLTPTVIATVSTYGIPSLVTIPNATIRRALLVDYTTVYAFATDPATPPSPGVIPPVPSAGKFVVID